MLTSPSKGTSVPPASQVFTSSYQWYSAATCAACLRLLLASKLRTLVSVGSVARPCHPLGSALMTFVLPRA
jgi:hypothetical protein